ncbi:MAG: hypothetical protein QHG99_04455 [Methanomicrobiales archaeon]|nr:hypothetical protein [Methanomicrobiales archaeon]
MQTGSPAGEPAGGAGFIEQIPSMVSQSGIKKVIASQETPGYNALVFTRLLGIPDDKKWPQSDTDGVKQSPLARSYLFRKVSDGKIKRVIIKKLISGGRVLGDFKYSQR